MGIEPTAQAWEAWVLPLYDARARHDHNALGSARQLKLDAQAMYALQEARNALDGPKPRGQLGWGDSPVASISTSRSSRQNIRPEEHDGGRGPQARREGRA